MIAALRFRRGVLIPVAAIAGVALLRTTFVHAAVVQDPSNKAELKSFQDTAAANESTRIILLGTEGGPGVTVFRSEPASLLVVNGTLYLIDAGSGVSRRIVSAGYQPTDISRIFFTHFHADHNAGLPALMSFMWGYRAWGNLRQPPVQIYGPPATEFLVHTALSYLSVSERIFRAGIPALAPAAPMFQGHDIKVGKSAQLVYQDSNVRVTAVENTHFTFPSGTPETGRDRSYAYRFDTAHGSIVFTGDTGPSDAVTRLARGADVLVSEVALCMKGQSCVVPPLDGNRPAAPPRDRMAEYVYHGMHEHLTSEELGLLAARAHVKVVLLTHFVPGDIRDMALFTAGVQKYFSGTVIPGEDLFEYDVR